MSEAPDEPQAAKPAGCGVALLALSAAGVLVAAGITAVTELSRAYFYVLLVTLFIVAAIGGPAFLRIRERPSWQNIAVAGFATGAIVPAVLGLPALTKPADYISMVGGFGLAGIAGALVAWLLVKWLLTGGLWAKAGVGLIVLVGVAAIWVRPDPTDRTCHNPLRNGGRSISATAGFNLRVPMAEWRAVEAELDGFADENGWDVQATVRPDYDFPWFQISLCREPGTEIFVSDSTPHTKGLSVVVMQPQGGDSWQVPLKRLQTRLERRWPGKVGYDEYYAARPPWARPSVQPSSPPLHPGEKSL